MNFVPHLDIAPELGSLRRVHSLVPILVHIPLDHASATHTQLCPLFLRNLPPQSGRPLPQELFSMTSEPTEPHTLSQTIGSASSTCGQRTPCNLVVRMLYCGLRARQINAVPVDAQGLMDDSADVFNIWEVTHDGSPRLLCPTRHTACSTKKKQ